MSLNVIYKNEKKVIDKIKTHVDFKIINLTGIGGGIPDILVYDKCLDTLVLIEIKTHLDRISPLQKAMQGVLNSIILQLDKHDNPIIDYNGTNKIKIEIIEKIKALFKK